MHCMCMHFPVLILGWAELTAGHGRGAPYLWCLFLSQWRGVCYHQSTQSWTR